MAGAPLGPSPLIELVRCRFRELAREPGHLFWVFGFPLLTALGLGLAFRSQVVAPPRVAVTDAVEAGMRQTLLASPRLQTARLTRPAAARALTAAQVALVVDQRGPGEPLIFSLDAVREPSLLARAITQDVLERAAGRQDTLSIEEHRTSERSSRYVDFLLPGLIGLNLMGSSMWGIGFNLVLARKRKLLRRYAVTPMRRSDFLLSYLYSRSLLVVLQVGVLLAFGRLVFGTKVQGSLLSLLVAAGFGAAAFAAIGLLIGARLSNTEAARGWMNCVQLPMWLLSGSFFAYERFPTWLQRPIRLLPLTAVNDALRRIYNQNGTLDSVSFELGVLATWVVCAFAIALRAFRWQ